MTTTTIELIEWLKAEADGAKEDDCPVAASYLIEAAKRLIELDEQVKQQINDYGRGMAVADLAIKPDCIYTLCADDSPTPQTLESACGGAMWYLGDDGKGAYPKFCHNCQGAVIVKEST